MKLRTVLIPVDGSFQAEEAVRTLQGLSLPEHVLLLTASPSRNWPIQEPE